MDEDQGPFITATRPYGFGDFGQAGARLVLHVDERDDPYYPVRGIQGTVQADLYPAGWDVRSTFGSIRAVAMGYHAIRIPLRPVLAVRIGAQKVFGDFPFHESAFLGGGPTVRNLTFQRYAGDTEVDATTELRVRVGRVPLVLPFDLGVFGLYEAGRVYVDGESPGGWRSALGGGVWIGLPDPSKAISISFTDGDFNRVFVRAGLTF
jgi:outer membrane protein assembly factor BamA